MFRLIGGNELLERGVHDLSLLRPVLSANSDALATNATLRLDEWRSIDDRVNSVFRERLTIVDELRNRGLVTPISLGSVLRVTERLEDFDPADLSFDGDTSPRADRPSFKKDIIPVPVISKDFQIGFRQLAASRERGEALDTTAAEIAARKVRDRMQALIALGMAAGGPAGGGIPGLTTAANRITVEMATPWNQSGGDPIGDVERGLEDAYSSNLFGPFVVYVAKNFWATIQGDYKASGDGTSQDRTIMERILAFSDIEAVRPLDALPDNSVVMVQMTREVIDLSEAQAVTTIQWERTPLVTNFRVMMVGGPQIKSIETDTGETINGIIHIRPVS